MIGSPWNDQADALFIWVAGGVWRHESFKREGKMFNETHLFDRVGDFLDALNKLKPFDEARHYFRATSIRTHILDKDIQWKQLQSVERPPWLSEDTLKGQFGEIGLDALHEATSRLRHAAGSNTTEWYQSVQTRERIFQKHERALLRKEEAPQRKKLKAQREEILKEEKAKAAQRQKEARLREQKETTQRESQREEKAKAAQREKEARLREQVEADQRQEEARWMEQQEEKKLEKQRIKRSKNLGYTIGTEYSGVVSTASPYPEPKFDTHGGAFRDEGVDAFWSLPSLTTTSTAQR